MYNQNFIDNGDKAINCDKNALNINALVLDLNNLFYTKAYWAHFRREKIYIFREFTRNFRELTRNFRE